MQLTATFDTHVATPAQFPLPEVAVVVAVVDVVVDVVGGGVVVVDVVVVVVDVGAVVGGVVAPPSVIELLTWASKRSLAVSKTDKLSCSSSLHR